MGSSRCGGVRSPRCPHKSETAGSNPVTASKFLLRSAVHMCHVCRLTETFNPKASKCRDCYNAYMREYMARRYAERRSMCIAFLGGACVRCGSQNGLEFDHIDRSTKSINVAKLILAKDSKLFMELSKCQLLCDKCHLDKTVAEVSVPHGGGAKGKHNCKCDLCRAANAQYAKRYKERRRNQATPA